MPSTRWRVVLVIAAALVVIGGVSGALVQWTPAPYPVGNPLALGGPAAALVTFINYVLATMLVLAGGALATASLIVRYRRAATIERQQLKWFAAVATVTALGGAANVLIVNSGTVGADGRHRHPAPLLRLGEPANPPVVRQSPLPRRSSKSEGGALTIPPNLLKLAVDGAAKTLLPLQNLV